MIKYLIITTGAAAGKPERHGGDDENASSTIKSRAVGHECQQTAANGFVFVFIIK